MMQSKNHPQKFARECRMQRGRHEEKPTAYQRAVVEEKSRSKRKKSLTSLDGYNPKQNSPCPLHFAFQCTPKSTI